MKTTRRGFLGLLAALPFVKAAKALPSQGPIAIPGEMTAVTMTPPHRLKVVKYGIGFRITEELMHDYDRTLILGGGSPWTSDTDE